MSGRQPRLPCDLAFGLPYQDTLQISHYEYVKHLKSHLEESYLLASHRALKSAERNKIRFDKLVTNSSLEVNDRVLVRNVRLHGKHKLAGKWESEVYVVIKRAGDLAVYTVRPETRDGPLRTLHRDLLLPCGFLPASEVSSPTLTKPTPKPRIRRSPGIEQSDDGSSFSDPEDEYPDGRYDALPVIKTVQFSTVHDICRSKGALDVSLNTDSTNPKLSDGNTVQANSADDSPVDAPDTYLPVDAPVDDSLVDAPDTWLPVDAPDEYLPVDTPTDNSPVDALGVPETSKIPNKDHTESENNLTVRRDEMTNVAEIRDAHEIEEEQN